MQPIRSSVLLLLLIAFSLLSESSAAQSFDGQPRHFPRRDAFVLEASPDLIERLDREGIPYQLRPIATDRLFLWVDEHEFESLRSEGWEIRWVPEEELVHWEAPKGIADEFITPATAYPTYDQLTLFLERMVEEHPDLCRLESIGQSVQGRELWFLKITDNPDVEEDEPEFKYISTMHGNEALGTPLMLNLIGLLLGEYSTDERIRGLVDETEIWIMPLMNPDGFSRNPRRRTNANGVDLNRNFPDPITDPVNSPNGRQPETQAVMAFGAAQASNLSANIHTGALVVNYPFDSQFAVTPDDDLFQAISLTYSSNNPPMFASPEFPNGITLGAEWYVVHGGMQDWNYVWLGCNEVTLELSNEFQPPTAELLQFWDDNRESMLAYMEQVHRGVRGLVTDARSGLPLAATIRVEGRDHSVFTDPDVGDYHRMLLPGTYTLTFQAEGFRTKTIPDVEVGPEAATRLDAALERDFSGILLR